MSPLYKQGYTWNFFRKTAVSLNYMWYSLIIGLIISSLDLIPNELHDLHLSKTDINYNSQNQAIEISLHLFIDDLELALEAYGQRSLLICTEKESSSAETYIAQYIEDHLKMRVDNQEHQIEFIGKEASDDLMGVWCYFELTNIAPPKSINVSIDFFNELYDDQKNVLFINYNEDNKEYFLLNKNKEQAQMSINHE